MFAITQSEAGVESIAHPNGDHKAAFDLTRFFGRDAIREIIDRLGLRESDTLINGRRRKVFHNDRVAITFTKDPWVDYPTDRHKENQLPVYKDEWGGDTNPLKPARAGYIHLIGDQSEVLTAYNLIQWRSFNKGKSLNYWGY